MSAVFQALRIRPWRLSDIGLMAAIEQQVYPFPWPEEVLLDCFNAGYHGWVAVGPKGRVVAYAIVQTVVDEAHLLNICTALDWQGQGVGRGMLRWVMSACRELSIERMLLEVRASNEPALGLYRAEGFVEDGVRKGYYPAKGGREDAILMSRKLLDIECRT